MSKILIKYPTRQRPKIFKEILNMYYNKLSGKHDYYFVITMDCDDPTMNNDDIRNFLNTKKNIKYCYGDSKTKVQAINAHLEDEIFDILILASDDMVPVVHEYDDIIVNEMIKNFPNMDGSVHFNDGRVGRTLNTLSIMGYNLYKEWGYIYHPDYVSLWCLDGDSKIFMSDYTLKPIKEIKIGDSVIGTIKKHGINSKLKRIHEFLHPTLVTKIHSRESETIKITFESGATTICTADHLWGQYAGNRGIINEKGEYSFYKYDVPKIGDNLVRVFNLPGESPKEYQKEIGWLSGMYDGEGSFPNITQSFTKNPENCLEIERIMNLLKIPYTLKSYDRSKWNLKCKKNDFMNVYYISGDYDSYIKFLDWCRPIRTNRYQVSKRLLTCRFGIPDKIIKIEPFKKQTVYCLTTNSGNFVADGILSHNCDNEFTDVTYRDNKAVYIDRMIIKHGWRDVTGEDKLSQRNEAFYQKDKITYELRKSKGFPKESVL